VASVAFFVAHLQHAYQLSLVDMMPKFFNMFVGPLAAMFFVGMFLPRATSRSVLPAVACGFAVSFVWSWWETIALVWPAWGEILGTNSQGQFKRPTIFLSIALPCVTTFVVAAVMSLLVERGGPHSGSGFTWRAIVKQPEGGEGR
jgi:Na+/proline symporter